MFAYFYCTQGFQCNFLSLENKDIDLELETASVDEPMPSIKLHKASVFLNLSQLIGLHKFLWTGKAIPVAGREVP
jgi:hypothetical protein